MASNGGKATGIVVDVYAKKLHQYKHNLSSFEHFIRLTGVASFNSSNVHFNAKLINIRLHVKDKQTL
jgi:hypothetical protein